MAGYGQDDQGFYTGSYAEQGGFDMSGSGNQYVQDPQFGQFDYSSQGYDQQGGMYPGAQQQQQAGYAGTIMTPDPVNYASDATDDFENEPPLMEELGINFDHITQKTLSVLNPMKTPDAAIMQDTDLAGPLVFCLMFGGSLLLTGKVHFGYIYGLGVVGCLAMYSLLNLMSMTGVSSSCVVSVLGYCLLPMVILSGISILISLQGILGVILTAVAVFWCSLSASKLFVTALAMDAQQLLVAYPCALVYGVFALLTVF